MDFAGLLAQTDGVALSILGTPATYTPGSGSPVSARCVFDSNYLRLDVGAPGVSSAGPAVFFRVADLPGGALSDMAATVTIASVVYQPWDVEPDGLGGVRFHLHAV